MNVQLIFCIETNKQADTDFIYVNETIKEFYQLKSHVKYPVQLLRNLDEAF